MQTVRMYAQYIAYLLSSRKEQNRGTDIGLQVLTVFEDTNKLQIKGLDLLLAAIGEQPSGPEEGPVRRCHGDQVRVDQLTDEPVEQVRVLFRNFQAPQVVHASSAYNFSEAFVGIEHRISCTRLGYLRWILAFDETSPKGNGLAQTKML